jgi:flagellin
MASIMTNASALTALQSLNATNKNLEITQSRISTGFRVNDASDNAAYWSIATTMRSDNQALSTVQDALGLGASKVDTAYTGMNKAIDTVNQIKTKLVSAYGATDADKAKIQTEIKALQAQMQAYADGATFSGTNMLSVKSAESTSGAADGVQTDVKIVSAFNRSAAGAASISTINVNVEGVKLYDTGGAEAKNAGILDRKTQIFALAADQKLYDDKYAATAGSDTAKDTAADGVVTAASVVTVSVSDFDITAAGVTDDVIGNLITKVDTALKDMTTAATNLGAAKSRIDLQKTFTQSLMDSIDRGVGQLVDADMNKESTRLQALQVQQQLGIQALSIANGSSQSILSLFR